MTLKTSIIALPLIVAGTFVSAQDIRYLSYGANYANTDGGDLLSLGGSVDYTNSGFIFNGSASYADADGGDLAALNFRLGYVINPKIALYAGASFVDDGFDDFASYNIGGEYGAGPYTAGLTLAETDEDNSETAISIYGGYKFSEAYEVALVLSDAGDDTSTTIVSDFDLGGTELFAVYNRVDDDSIFAVNGAYDLGNNFRVGAGYATFDDGVDSFNFYSISGGYEASEDLWIDLGYGEVEDVDVISLSVNFETGRETLLVDRVETATVNALGVLGSALGGGF